MSLKPPILTVGKFDFYAVSEHGMTFVPETPRAEWLDAVKRLTHFYEGSEMARERCLMCLADALNFGELAFSEEFAQAIDSTREALGLSPKTIANAQWVYKKIDASRRRDGITLGHYSVIAALEPETQDRFINEALREHMTVSTLKEHVAEHHPKTKRGQKRATKPKATFSNTDDAESITLKLAECAAWLTPELVTKEMKDSLGYCYKLYRRVFISKKKS